MIRSLPASSLQPSHRKSPTPSPAPLGALPLAIGPTAAGHVAATLRIAIFLLVIVPLVGCGESEQAERRRRARQPIDTSDERYSQPIGLSSVSAATKTDAPEDRESDAEVSVNVADWESILAEVKASGKPVVLDIWSLNCEPCMREFPGLVALKQEYGDQLMCVSVNTDFDGRVTHPAEGYLSEVSQFLEATSARMTNFICDTPNEEVYAAVDIVSIPAVLVFDKSGNEVKRFVDSGDTIGFTYESHVAPFVGQMFESASAPATQATAEDSADDPEAEDNA